MHPDTPKSKQDTDKEVLLILNELQANAMQNTTPMPIPEGTPDPLIVVDEILAEGATPAEEAPTEEVVQLTANGVKLVDDSSAHAEDTPVRKPNFVVRVWRSLIPVRGDGGVEILRKCLFMVAFWVLVSSAVYLVHDSVWIPAQNNIMNEELEEIMHGIDNPTPEQHRQIMQALYAKNNDFRAWLTYKSVDSDFLQIDYPVVHYEDNDYYLERDFYGNYNKNGTLFFDMRNNFDINTTPQNKVSIIYGHNMISGQMLAQLNQMINNISYVKAAPTMKLDTFQGSATYKVFAVVVLDATSNADYFDYLRTSFYSDLDFLYYINELKARSLYNFDDVSVYEDDELLLLSTCTNEGQVHMENGRLAVFARKVRLGEKETVDTSKITYNDNVIMPPAWYANQEKDTHPYYNGEYVIPEVTTTAASTPDASATYSDSTTANTQVQMGGATTDRVDIDFGSGGQVIVATLSNAKPTKTTGTTAATKPAGTTGTTKPGTTAGTKPAATTAATVATTAATEVAPSPESEGSTPASNE